MKSTLPVRYVELKKNVDLANKLHPTKLAGKKLLLQGSQREGYILYLVAIPNHEVLGAIAYGNFKEIMDAINVFCCTVQIL